MTTDKTLEIMTKFFDGLDRDEQIRIAQTLMARAGIKVFVSMSVPEVRQRLNKLRGRNLKWAKELTDEQILTGLDEAQDHDWGEEEDRALELAIAELKFFYPIR